MAVPPPPPGVDSFTRVTSAILGTWVLILLTSSNAWHASVRFKYTGRPLNELLFVVSRIKDSTVGDLSSFEKMEDKDITTCSDSINRNATPRVNAFREPYGLPLRPINHGRQKTDEIEDMTMKQMQLLITKHFPDIFNGQKIQTCHSKTVYIVCHAGHPPTQWISKKQKRSSITTGANSSGVCEELARNSLRNISDVYLCRMGFCLIRWSVNLAQLSAVVLLVFLTFILVIGENLAKWTKIQVT